MIRVSWLAGVWVGIFAGIVGAQTGLVPKPPFTAAQTEHGKEIAAKSLEIRAQIKNMRDPAEPFKIMGNLYFVGVANGEVYLLTSPQGHIMFGAAFPDTVDQIQKSVEAIREKSAVETCADVFNALKRARHQRRSAKPAMKAKQESFL